MNNPTVAVIGLGYVGLPLALAFARHFDTIGFDLDARKIASYQAGRALHGEAEPDEFARATRARYTTDPVALQQADILVLAIPTPVTESRRPDLEPLLRATEMVGAQLKRGAIVVYESTVYPGVTEEVCGPVLERVSGLRRGRDFRLAYSPERINPGDREHGLEQIVKVVSGEDAETLERVAQLYAAVVPAGVHRAPSIQVAEAAKVIENTQRDLNIALMNELAIIFNKLGLDTAAVLEAAGTKWNFLPFRPGLVGGHCIGVDPYYLTYRAEMAGYHPQVILAGRRINDSMGRYVARQTIKQMARAGRPVTGATVLVLGLAFKENCADLRNSRVADLVDELQSYGVRVAVWDPLVDAAEAAREYGISPVAGLDAVPAVDAIVAAVAHDEFRGLDLTLLAAKKGDADIPFMDVKSAFPPAALQAQGFRVWRL